VHRGFCHFFSFRTIYTGMPCSHIFGGSHIFVESFPVMNDSSCVCLDSPKSSQIFADTYFYQLLALNKCWMSKDFHVLCQCHFNYNYFLHSNKKEPENVSSPKKSSPRLMPNLNQCPEIFWVQYRIWARAT
jgi:hypothetical protein